MGGEGALGCHAQLGDKSDFVCACRSGAERAPAAQHGHDPAGGARRDGPGARAAGGRGRRRGLRVRINATLLLNSSADTLC